MADRPLDEVVRTRREEIGFSYREVVALARSRGRRLSLSTLHGVERGTITNPRETTLAALADGLATPVAELRDAVGIERPGAPWKPPAGADKMTRPQRKLVEGIIKELTG